MELNYLGQLPLGGFNYDNCLRNTALEAQTSVAHKTSYTKTGTTICGLIFNVSTHIPLSFELPKRSQNLTRRYLLTDFHCSFRVEFVSALILEPRLVRSWLTRTARSSTSWRLIFTALEPAQPLTAITSPVSVFCYPN